MGKIFWISTALIVCLSGGGLKVIDDGISEATDSIVTQMRKHHYSRLAIGDFVNNGTKTMLERYIENEIVNNIISRGEQSLAVIERRRLSEVLAEQKLGTTGLLEKSTRATLGKILGVDAIVSGETIITSREVKVNVRLYGVDTGSILSAPSFVFERNGLLDELIGEPALSSKGKNILSTEQKALKFQNRVTQKISYLFIMVQDFKRIKNALHLTLKFRSLNRKYGAAVAIYAEGSDNIADFWKFFPRPKMIELSDENGHGYIMKSTTMRYAKTNDDWTKIPVKGERIVQFVFAKNSKTEIGHRFTFSALIHAVMVDDKGKARRYSPTIYLNDLIVH